MPQPLFNPNDSLTGRDGGPYLDVEEAKDAERRRALVEDRDEDFDDMPAYAGIPLVTGSELVSTAYVNNLPSQESNDFVGRALEELKDNDDIGAKPWSEAPTPEELQKEADKQNAKNDDDDAAVDSVSAPAKKTTARKQTARKTTAVKK